MSKNWKSRKVENLKWRGDDVETGVEIGVRPVWRSAFGGFGGGGMVAGSWVSFLLWVSWRFLMWVSWYGGEAGV